jgi:hypothetical protein
MFSVGEPALEASELRKCQNRPATTEVTGDQGASEPEGCGGAWTEECQARNERGRDEGGTPEVWGVYQRMLRPGLDLRPLGRFEFYAACREPDVAVCVATGMPPSTPTCC